MNGSQVSRFISPTLLISEIRAITTTKEPGTTIHVKETTRQRLLKHGKMGDSFDKLINHILDQLESKERPEPMLRTKEARQT